MLKEREIRDIFTSGAYFITGIDTDSGKTFCTAWLVRRLMESGVTVITQKFIQTGNPPGFSEDIEAHRRLSGTGPLPEDKEKLTAPIILSYPASAQLAARIDGVNLDLSVIDRAREELEGRYEVVLVEGAGGLMVPISDDFFAIDYASSRNIPAVLVTNSRLGSINHTVLSLQAIKSRGLRLAAVLYNRYYDTDMEISTDTREFVERFVRRHFPGTPILDVPVL